MAARPLITLLSLLLLAGAILLVFLTLLGGAVDRNPTNQFYFLEADTSGIAGAAPLTRWTFWNACSVSSGRNDCPKVHAAHPLDPSRNFQGSDDKIPRPFTQHRLRYYFLTRFMFAFALIALFFAVLALFSSLLALCSRVGGFLSSGLCSLACLFQTVTAALMTAAYVQGRRNFRSDGRTANLGKYSFGFMWAAVACLLLSTILFCVGGAAPSNRRFKTTAPDGYPHDVENPARIKFFQNEDNTTNRKSYIDSEDQRHKAYL